MIFTLASINLLESSLKKLIKYNICRNTKIIYLFYKPKRAFQYKKKNYPNNYIFKYTIYLGAIAKDTQLRKQKVFIGSRCNAIRNMFP